VAGLGEMVIEVELDEKEGEGVIHIM